MITVREIEKIYPEIAKTLRRTPLFRSKALENVCGVSTPIYLKAENLQITGSFKSRGALAKLLSLSEAQKKQGIIAASGGNHAQGVAYHAQRLGIQAKIIMPQSTPWVKINATKQWGAEIELLGDSYQEAFQEALKIQKEENRIFIHAFDDEAIVCGQGTIALEILEDCPSLEVFISPIGGGGLMAGSAVYLKEKKPNIKIVGVQAEGCSTFIPSREAKKPITLASASTIAEGISAKRMGDITFEICNRLVDRAVTVSDEEISEGILWCLENERLFVEGCAGATVAAALKYRDLLTGPAVVLLSGGNLDVNLLARIIERGLVKAGRLLHLVFTIPDAPGSLHRLLETFATERASILQVRHDRIFGKSSLREVQAQIISETQGPDHNERLMKQLTAKGYRYTIGAASARP